MRSVAVLAFVVLLLTAFAGCAEPPSEASGQAKPLGSGRAVKAVNRTAIEQRLNRNIATSGQESLGDWFVLSASAGPEGNLTGFRMQLPDGVLVPPSFDRVPRIALEVVPIVVGPPEDIQEWMLLAFVIEAGRARLIDDDLYSYEPTFILETPRTFADVAAPSPSQTEVPISLAPRFLQLTDPHLRAPGSLLFVVAARAKAPVEFGVAFRLLDHRPVPAEKPVPDLESFLLDVGRAIPFGIKRVGKAAGFLAATYETETALFNPQVISHEDIRSAGVKVEDRVSVRQVPAVEVRDSTVSAGSETKEGWTHVSGFFLSTCGTGKYQARIEAHGKTFAPRGVIAQHIICGGIYGGLAQGIVFGFTVDYRFAADGPGASQASFEWQVAHALLEQMQYRHITLGATLTSLLGVPAMQVQEAEQGLVGNVPPGA